MKRLIYKYISALSLLIVISSCTYEFKADIPSDTSILIVEGQILVGGTSLVNVSKAANLNGESSYSGGIVRASGVLRCEDGTEIDGVSETGNGTTISNNYILVPHTATIRFDTDGIDPSKRYKLYIDAGDDGTFESDWLIFYEAPVIDTLDYSEDEGVITSSSSYIGRAVNFRLTAHSDYSPYFIITYDEAWEYTALANSHFQYNPQTNTVDDMEWIEHPYYRCWNESPAQMISVSAESHSEDKIIDAYLTRISAYDDKISILYRITVNVGSSSKEFQEYWDNLEKISYVDGDLFTPIPSSMEGNIHRTSGSGTVLGYVCASKVDSRTLYYRNHNFYRYPPLRNQLFNLWTGFHIDMENPDDPHQYYCPNDYDYPGAYKRGYVPLREAYNKNGEVIRGLYVWAKADCVDCRYFGGRLDFPEDWPDRNDPNL